ncbi:HBR541Cp [Eremothecium sinecaudum]|uniref:Cysteine protease n=1 Tax=Eremothecium sinecaudum TaxID=45286 RepID=A0A120K1J7_9SACH|nr:HBR541Cp [Eremothecium sinecaudum]AMD19442.1 HBR541Cp [Eremothecium sinecaudum]
MDIIQRMSQSLRELNNSDLDNSLVVLGVQYSPTVDDWGKQDEDMPVGLLHHILPKKQAWNPEFLLDVKSRLHFTYRTRFSPIVRHPDGPSPLSIGALLRNNPLNVLENVMKNSDCFITDIGWGCMIRTGQSLLANALQRVKLGRDFRTTAAEDPNDKELTIIRWFQDDIKYPFSLHKFVQEGFELSGKKPGEWFGPSATSMSIQSLVKKFPACGINQCTISTSSGDVYLDQLDPLFEADRDTTLLLLLCVRLGVNDLNEYYWNDIKQILTSKQSVGIAGGRPSSSLYFFGYQGDYLFYLDPHHAQPQLCSYKDEADLYNSVHPQKFNKIHLSAIDPSMLVGILILGKEDWKAWKKSIKSSRIIHLSDSQPPDILLDNDIERLITGDKVAINGQKDLKSELDSGDYIDVGSFLHSAEPHKLIEPEDEYQEVHCKNQRIVVMSETAEAGGPQIEVEKVLVEDQTIPVRSK